MVVQTDYSIEDLLTDGSNLFPKNTYQVICFGYLGSVADVKLTNGYTATANKNENLFPLMTAGVNLMPEEKIRRQIL